MMTIEARADAYVGHSEEIDEFSSATIKRHAFIDGAKEQREIDIEKSVRWVIETIAPIFGDFLNADAIRDELTKHLMEE